MVATLYIFGLKRGVGLDTMSEFFARLPLQTQTGCSSSALRQGMRTLETALRETAAAWERDGGAGGEGREIIGAVDDTFLERMILVCMDLRTGYLLLEEAADDRTYSTWKALREERLKALGTSVRYLGSDRAQALVQLAEHGLECLSMPAFFHVVHDIVKSYSLAIGRHVRQAQQALTQATEAYVRLQEPPHRAPEAREAQVLVAARHAEVQQWTAVQRMYRYHLETLSRTLHPFGIADSTPQTSAQVASQLHAAVEAIAAVAKRQQLPARDRTMQKVRKQIPALAALIDYWWEGVERDLEHAAISAPWRQWAKECLLPWVYGEHPVAHTRCVRRKAKRQQACEAVRTAWHTHVLTLCLPAQALEHWRAWAMQQGHAFQRASSAVEGRNGGLAQLHHNQRGLPKRRDKGWTVLPNFDCCAADGTTPASRFFKRTFPDLFETVLSQVNDLPRPRQRKHQGALTY